MIERTLYPRMAVALLALLGIINAGYLTLSRIYPSALVCLTGGGCEAAAQSPYSLFPPGSGIPVAHIGIAGYLVLLVLALIALQTDRLGPLPVPATLFALSTFGVLFSIYLTSMQVFVIKTPTGEPGLCSWCLLSGLTQVCIWVALLLDWRARRASMERAQPAMAGVAPGVRPR